MSTPTVLVIDAVVAESERPALEATASQLRECLTAASGADWPIELRFHDSLPALVAHGRSTIVVASMLPELARAEVPPAAVDARWRESLALLAADSAPLVLICTIFRHVGEPPSGEPGARMALRERLRRLNMLAIELSHDTGAGVADIDRTFAHVGARPLGTDHRLGGPAATETAARIIVRAMFGPGLDAVVPRDVQARALDFLGPLDKLEDQVAERLARQG